MPFKKDWAEDWKEQFIVRIGDDNRSLRSVTSDKDMPAHPFVYKEMERDPAFATRYAQAADDRADGIFEECLEIADADDLTPEEVQRARLRIDTRKWMVGKLRPSKYSDKLDIDLKAKMNVTIGPDDTDL